MSETPLIRGGFLRVAPLTEHKDFVATATAAVAAATLDKASTEMTERDYEAAAHVRWPDADYLRETLAARSVNLQATWQQTCLQASIIEQSLLTRNDDSTLKAMVRPFTVAGQVQALGVHRRYAALVRHESRGVNGNVNVDDVERQIWTCHVSRSSELEWTRSKMTLAPALGPVLCSALYDCTMALLFETRLRLVQLPSCKRIILETVYDGASATAFALGSSMVALISDNVLRVWSLQDPAMPLKCLQTVNALKLTSLRVHGDRILCGDTQGHVVAYSLTNGVLTCVGRVALLKAPHHSIEAITSLEFGGSRFQLGTSGALYSMDWQRGHECYVSSQNNKERISTPLSLASWGQALVTHDASNLLLIRDARSGALVHAFPHRDLVAELPRLDAQSARYQSLCAAGDQLALLYPNGLLLFIDIDADMSN
jgi:hypothetical protein